MKLTPSQVHEYITRSNIVYVCVHTVTLCYMRNDVKYTSKRLSLLLSVAHFCQQSAFNAVFRLGVPLSGRKKSPICRGDWAIYRRPSEQFCHAVASLVVVDTCSTAVAAVLCE